MDQRKDTQRTGQDIADEADARAQAQSVPERGDNADGVGDTGAMTGQQVSGGEDPARDVGSRDDLEGDGVIDVDKAG